MKKNLQKKLKKRNKSHACRNYTSTYNTRILNYFMTTT